MVSRSPVRATRHWHIKNKNVVKGEINIGVPNEGSTLFNNDDERTYFLTLDENNGKWQSKQSLHVVLIKSEAVNKPVIDVMWCLTFSYMWCIKKFVSNQNANVERKLLSISLMKKVRNNV